MIGDPSGKSDMRSIMTKEKIDYNAKRFAEQLSRFITFDDDKAIQDIPQPLNPQYFSSTGKIHMGLSFQGVLMRELIFLPCCATVSLQAAAETHAAT